MWLHVALTVMACRSVIVGTLLILLNMNLSECAHLYILSFTLKEAMEDMCKTLFTNSTSKMRIKILIRNNVVFETFATSK